MLKIILGYAFLAACAIARGPASVAEGRLEIPVGDTGAEVRQADGPHVAYWNSTLNNGKLLLTFGGTTAPAKDFADFAQVAVERGYQVLSVDYPNSVITTVCRERDQTQCFDHFREEIGLGIPVSDIVEVDANNSIYHRIVRLLEYLGARDPRWKPFLKNGSVDWRDVVVAGNSQGSGHAAFLSKSHEVARVIMIAGPQDHFVNRPAPWISKRSQTPGERYLALLHERDYFDSKLQLKVFKKLCRCEDLKHVIISNKDVPDFHNSLLSPLYYRDEWAQLLKLD